MDLAVSAGEDHLFGPWRDGRFDYPLHYLPHLLEPPLGARHPALPAGQRRARLSVFQAQLHLSVIHIVPFFLRRFSQGHLDKGCPGEKNVMMRMYNHF